MSDYDVWRKAINQLSTIRQATTTQIGIALLDRATRGELETSWCELCDLCDLPNQRTVALHLNRLRAAGVIAYGARGTHVTVAFRAWQVEGLVAA